MPFWSFRIGWKSGRNCCYNSQLKNQLSFAANTRLIRDFHFTYPICAIQIISFDTASLSLRSLGLGCKNLAVLQALMTSVCPNWGWVEMKLHHKLIKPKFPLKGFVCCERFTLANPGLGRCVGPTTGKVCVDVWCCTVPCRYGGRLHNPPPPEHRTQHRKSGKGKVKFLSPAPATIRFGVFGETFPNSRVIERDFLYHVTTPPYHH